ncbi:MAG: hypothetical protein ACPL2D_07525 [Ignavibacteria bacterium]
MKKPLLSLWVLFLFLSGCNSEDISNPEQGETVNRWSFRAVNDTATIEFEVKGMTVNEPKDFTNLMFSSYKYSVNMELTELTSGNLTLKIYKLDSISVFTKIYSAIGSYNNIDSCTPSLNHIMLVPYNFSGKGKLIVFVR